MPQKIKKEKTTVKNPLHLFEGIGVELEYMIVRKRDLSVASIADRILKTENGITVNELNRGEISWSNELAAHVIELKTSGPVRTLKGVSNFFHENIRQINEILAAENAEQQAMLLPTAMHPWMDPAAEFHLWPYENSEIYEAFNKIFKCGGHGWSNLQSIHINLPFANDDEFGRLHAAIRLVLPILPALAASSPIVEGRATGILDNRLRYYGTNSAIIPSITGGVIPEQVYSRSQYEAEILEPIYRDLDPLDPEGILQEEWVNARGAIARFDRNTIEIRLLDIQENPHADIALVHTILETVRALTEERFASFEAQKSIPTALLKDILQDAIKRGERSEIRNAGYLNIFGCKNSPLTIKEIWVYLMDTLPPSPDPLLQKAIHIYKEQGSLSTRILNNLKFIKESETQEGAISHDLLEKVYRQLAESLQNGSPYESPRKK